MKLGRLTCDERTTAAAIAGRWIRREALRPKTNGPAMILAQGMRTVAGATTSGLGDPCCGSGVAAQWTTVDTRAACDRSGAPSRFGPVAVEGSLESNRRNVNEANAKKGLS